MKQKTYLSKIDQLQKTIDYYLKNSWNLDCNPAYSTCLDNIHLGIFLRNHKLYKKGDICIIEMRNGGGESYPVYSVSSVGVRLKDYYVTCFRWRESKYVNLKHRVYRKVEKPVQFTGNIKLIEMPDEIKTMSLFDPTFQRFVESYAQDLSKVG